MADEVYTIHVTGEQLEAVSELFNTNGWQLQVDEKGLRVTFALSMTRVKVNWDHRTNTKE